MRDESDDEGSCGMQHPHLLRCMVSSEEVDGGDEIFGPGEQGGESVEFVQGGGLVGERRYLVDMRDGRVEGGGGNSDHMGTSLSAVGLAGALSISSTMMPCFGEVKAGIIEVPNRSFCTDSSMERWTFLCTLEQTTRTW
nr:hypothetical protein CFP56_53328 [Quercus suber]